RVLVRPRAGAVPRRSPVYRRGRRLEADPGEAVRHRSYAILAFDGREGGRAPGRLPNRGGPRAFQPHGRLETGMDSHPRGGQFAPQGEGRNDRRGRQVTGKMCRPPPRKALATLLTLALAALLALPPADRAAPPGDPAAPGPWATYRGNPQRTGC